MKAVLLFVLIGILSADDVIKTPKPLGRVSGKSFIPNKSMNTEVINIKTDLHPFSFGPSSLVKTKSQAISFCGACIDFADQALNFLLNYILQVGVVGSCAEICAYAEKTTGSKLVGVVCDALCDVAGIEEFIKIIEKADLDPIYYCELVHACEIFDQGDANITSFRVTPNRGPQGTFVITADWFSKNGTGTGEIYIGIRTVDGVPVEDSFLMEPQKPGKYTTEIKLNAVPNPECDPSQEECENWLAGNYKVEIAICNGECGSAHPHSKIYDQAITNFTITN